MDSHTAKVIKNYDECAPSYTKELFDDRTDDQDLEAFSRLLPPGGNILDAGCGPGQFSRFLIERGFECIGIDLSREMIKIARERIPEGRFEIMDIRKLDFKNATFDGVLAWGVFLHIRKSDSRSAILELKRVLKPGGFLMMHEKEGNKEGIEELDDGDKKRLYWIRLWKEQELLETLKNCGFEIVSFSKRPSTSPLEYQSNKLIAMARKPFKREDQEVKRE